MKRLLVFLLLPMLFLGCKKKSPEVSPDIAAIVGKWKLEAYEKTVNGQKVWEKVAATDEPHYIWFRFDGVILDSKGLPSCCAPDAFNLNGNPFKIEAKAAIPENPSCAFVDCVGCSSWNIKQTDNELIIELCSASFPRSKFIRV